MALFRFIHTSRVVRIALPLAAVAGISLGSLFRGSNVASTVRNHAGAYSIVFDEPIPGQSGERPGCAMSVTPTSLEGDFTTHTRVSPLTYTGSATTVHVEPWEDPIGEGIFPKTVDQSFSLALTC